MLTDERLLRCGILLTKRFIKEAAHMKKLSFSIVTATLIAAVLSACGGGGSDSSGQAGSGAASAGTTGDNSLAYLVGTYVFPCDGIITELSNPPSRTSDQGTIVIKTNATTGKVEVSANIKAYEGSANWTHRHWAQISRVTSQSAAKAAPRSIRTRPANL